MKYAETLLRIWGFESRSHGPGCELPTLPVPTPEGTWAVMVADPDEPNNPPGNTGPYLITAYEPPGGDEGPAFILELPEDSHKELPNLRGGVAAAKAFILARRPGSPST